MAAELDAAHAGENVDMEPDYDVDEIGVAKDLTPDGGLKKTILRAGEGWESPDTGDEVSVHYVGTLASDGSKFDSSRDRGEPFVFKLGEGRVIKGWDEGVATMRRGELARLECGPEYAYGAAGSPPSIPPGATLLFEVELLSWKSVKDLTGDGGVVKTVLAEGRGWATPKPEDELVVAYSARVTPPPPAGAGAAAAAGGKKAPSAAERGLPVVAASPEGGAAFTLASAPCSGLGVALKTMKPGEAARLLLAPAYAKGLADVPDDGSLLEVEVTLTSLHAVTHPAPGVTKKVLADPEGVYARPNAGSRVTLTLSASSPDGSVVYEPPHEVEFVTDEEALPEGVELAVATMREGERALVTVSEAALTAAPSGAVAGAGVPPGTAPVVYDLTLRAFTKGKERWEMSNADKLAAALAAKDKGNAAYKAGNLLRAVRQYAAAHELASAISERDLAPPLPGAPPTSPPGAGEDAAGSVASLMAAARDVKKAAASNLAAAELKRCNWAEAAKQAGLVLEVDPGNVKALFRRASARMGLGDLLEAELDVRAGLLAEPGSADLLALQRKLKLQMRDLNKKQAKLYSRMFSALGSGPEAAGATTPPAAAEEPAPEEDTHSAPAAAAPAAPIVQAAA